MTNTNIKFRGNDDNVIAYDDTVSQERRKMIREDYEYQTMPYYDIYEKEPRLDGYQLKKMIDFYANKPKKVDGDMMSELPLSNLHNISNTYRYRPEIYRGSTMCDSPDWVLNKVKDAGIKTVINLGGSRDRYKKRVEDAGLNFFDYDVDAYVHSMYVSDLTKKDKLVEFISEMQKEKVYIGCECGTYRTDQAIFLNTLFNPKVKGYCKIYSPEKASNIPYFARDMYLLLTSEDKEKLGWTPEFEARFREKIFID